MRDKQKRLGIGWQRKGRAGRANKRRDRRQRKGGYKRRRQGASGLLLEPERDESVSKKSGEKTRDKTSRGSGETAHAGDDIRSTPMEAKGRLGDRETWRSRRGPRTEYEVKEIPASDEIEVERGEEKWGYVSRSR